MGDDAEMMPTRENLAISVDEAEWAWLRGHMEQGGLIVVGPTLDLVDAGLGIALDDAAAVEGWIREKRLTKPSAEQVAAWDRQKGKRFLMLIVSPFVLIKEEPGTVFHS
jgi:hypothetical protein